MKIIFSDFDGVIKNGDMNSFLQKIKLKSDREEIDDFIKNGNKFIISTSRNTDSIKNVLNTIGLDFNYLITYNGRVIFDKNFNIIHASYIENNILNDIKYILDNIRYKRVHFFNEYGSTNTMNNLVVLIIKTFDKNAYKYFKALSLKYKDLKIDYNSNKGQFCLSIRCNKLNGAMNLIEKEGLTANYENIYAIGSDSSNIALLEKFNGYKTNNHSEELYNIKNQTRSVKQLIKQIK